MMREIIGHLHNEFFTRDAAGALVANAQVVLLYREQHYAIRKSDIIETSLNRDFSFRASAADLRRLSADLAKVADSLEENTRRREPLGAAA